MTLVRMKLLNYIVKMSLVYQNTVNTLTAYSFVVKHLIVALLAAPLAASLYFDLPIRVFQAVNLLVILVVSFCHLTPWELLKVFCTSELGPGKYAACMYFHGYLNKICPVSESQGHPELYTRMIDHEEIEQIKFEFYKLFILIPKSGHAKPKIGEGSQYIDDTRNLQCLKLNRAGVKGRKYDNTVYRVCLDRSRTSKAYVVVEYASALATILDFSKSLPDCLKSLKETILVTFYDHLKELLEENPSCGKYCELILYDDKDVDEVTALQTRLKQLMADRISSHKYEMPSPPSLYDNDQASSPPTHLSTHQTSS